MENSPVMDMRGKLGSVDLVVHSLQRNLGYVRLDASIHPKAACQFLAKVFEIPISRL